MVTYGGKEWIPRALAALAANTTVPYEVIIVDNASPASTLEVLAAVTGEGVTVIYNDRNVGFGPACNQGVLYATAPFICLLNSDAFVEPGWLPPLLDALERDPRAGAAVPCLLHVDGTLQEAAGAVGSDGATRALGDGASADQLQYRFRRYVDYGSAACLVMRRSVFARIGGFDPAYPMGYCEDVDLCFALGDLGLRTVYEPRARVRHVRWGSSSRSQAERRVFANQPILLARWRERLAGRPTLGTPPFREHDILQARDAEAFDRILVVGDGAADHRSSPARVAWLASGLARWWPDARVTLLVGESSPPSRVDALLAEGVEVACEADWEPWLQERRFHYSAVLLSGAVCFERFDPLIEATQPQAARIFDLERLAHSWAHCLSGWWPPAGAGAQGPAAAGPAGLLAGRLRSLETWGVESADLILCASRDSLAFARSVDPTIPAHLVPTLVGPGHAGGAAGLGFEDRLGYQAVGHLPAGVLSAQAALGGAAALLEPLRSIARALAALDPRHTIGATPGIAHLLAQTRPDQPPDSLAPGGPARVLLLAPPFGCHPLVDIVAFGTPVVLWRAGAEGMDLGDLEPLLLADDAAGFARRARDLHEDRALWEHVQGRLAQLADRLAGEPGSPATRQALWDALAHCGWGTPVPQARAGA